MDIAALSPKEKKELLKQLEAEQKADAQKRAQEIENYKSMQDSIVCELLPGLVGFSEKQKEIVGNAFKELDTLIALKKELFTTKETQDSHTFTHRNGLGSITIGHNTIIGFDGTESAGVAKIREFITTLSADDENRAVLGGLLNTFMKLDKKGNLNPTRIAELYNKKAEIDDPNFHEGIDIIMTAQHKSRTTTFVRGWQVVKEGEEIRGKITFSITV